MNRHRMPWGLALATATLLGLTACGGGSDTPAATATTTTFSGTAATGAALANATVTITCASGTGTTTTATNGSYTKDLTGITLPCALKAASSDGTTVLYSVTTATATSSSTQVANITPLTQLLVASLAGTDPATFFDTVTSSPASITSVVTASAVSTAQTAVLTLLSDAGIDTSSLTSTGLISGSLVAGSNTGYDGILESLYTLITSTIDSNPVTALASLTTTVATTSTATTTGTTNVASLPAALLLKTADTNCSALRSGDYWAISPTMGGTIANQYTSGSYNASTKAATNLVGGSTVFSNASTTCRYLAADGVSDIVVSQAGLVVARYRDGSNVYRLGFAIPKQTIALSELAGTWNALGFSTTTAGTSYKGEMWTATVGSAGVTSDAIGCDGTSPTSTCSAVSTSNLPTFSSNSDGGFNVTTPAFPTDISRAFAYRAGNGDLMLVMVDGDGSVSTWTKQRTLSLPDVNTIQSASWSIRALSTLVANALNISYPATVTAVDSVAGSFTRTVNMADGTVDYSETILQNTPRAGYNFRAVGSTTSVSGSGTANIRERTSLGLRGMGVSVQSVPVQTGISSAGFQMSVDQP